MVVGGRSRNRTPQFSYVKNTIPPGHCKGCKSGRSCTLAQKVGLSPTDSVLNQTFLALRRRATAPSTTVAMAARAYVEGSGTGTTVKVMYLI